MSTTAHTTRTDAGYVLAPGDGDRIPWFDGALTLKTLGAGAPMDFGEFVVARGGEPPLHVHRHEDEFMYVLEGEMTVYLGDREQHASPGSFVWMPRGVPHTYALASERLRVIGGGTPAGFFQVFHDLVAAFGGALPAELGPEHAETFTATFERYGVQLLGPNPGHAPA